MIANEYAVKLYMEHEVKRGNKIVKKELIVTLRDEIYFVKFIINPKEDDVEPGVIFRRSFLCMTKAITNFRAGTITIYTDIDQFLEDIKEEEKSMDDWDQLLDFNLDDIPLLGREELLLFVCKMGKSNRNKKRVMENLNLFYQDIGTSSSTGRHLTQEETAKEALALRISQKFALLEEVRPVLETMAYYEKYKEVLDEIWKDKVELDRMIVKEEEKAIKKVKGEALKEKDDPKAFIFPIRLEGKVNENTLAHIGSDINTMPYQIYEQLGREEMKKVDMGITMINHTQTKAMGILTDVLFGWGFLYTTSDIVNIPERLFLTFDGICHQTFCAARSDVLRTVKNDSDDEEKYEIKRNKFRAPIYGCNKDVKSRYNTKLANLLPRHVYSMCVVNWDILNRMGCDGEINDMLRIKLRKEESNEEIFTFVAWIRAFNIKETIYVDLCHEFYSTYEFDEVFTDDELQTKKIIKFRLGECAHNLTLLEFACRLRLYHVDELEDDGFDVYFQGGLHSDEHFNAQEYWLSISREDNLGLSRSHTSTFRSLILRVIHNTPKWVCECGLVIARWMKRKGTDDVIRSMIALSYCRDLDTTTLRKLIDYEGRLIPEDPQPSVPRVGIP
nr:hypothetical protein [Tanacetum cinerariifolium]